MEARTGLLRDIYFFRGLVGGGPREGRRRLPGGALRGRAT